MDAMKYEIYKVTERREGCVYKTKKIASVWIKLPLLDIPYEESLKMDHEVLFNQEQKLLKEIAQKYGGDFEQATTEMIFNVKQLPEPELFKV